MSCCGFSYEIRDKNDSSLIYYGISKLTNLDDQIKSHLNDLKCWKISGNGYDDSFIVLEKNNYIPKMLKLVWYNTDSELKEYYRHLINNKICVNKNVSNITNVNIYQANKDKIKKRSNDYNKKNRDKINQRATKKFTCPCGGKYTGAHKSDHDKTKRHQKWLVFK